MENNNPLKKKNSIIYFQTFNPVMFRVLFRYILDLNIYNVNYFILAMILLFTNTYCYIMNENIIIIFLNLYYLY